MKMTEMFLAELDREAAAARRTLERVPDGRDDWKPHPKSMPLGYLSTLVAIVLGWTDLIINRDEFDIAPVGGGEKPPQPHGKEELLAALDSNVAKARKALTSTTDEHLMTNWKLKAGGHVVDDRPRHIHIRDNVFMHLAHHRGQLTVYLRLNDAKVPSIYGPSADERG